MDAVVVIHVIVVVRIARVVHIPRIVTIRRIPGNFITRLPCTTLFNFHNLLFKVAH